MLDSTLILEKNPLLYKSTKSATYCINIVNKFPILKLTYEIVKTLA